MADMCLAEIMAKAAYDLWCSKLQDGEETLPWEEYEDEIKAEPIEEMRAILRVVASTKLPDAAVQAGRRAQYAAVHAGGSYDGAFEAGMAAALLAAAEEGERSAPALSTAGDGHSDAAQ